MKTYKLGNKIKCIIRSFSSGKIGEQDVPYANQPYTVLKDVEASLLFGNRETNAKSITRELSHNIEFLQEITISNVTLNDKILNLIFLKNEEKLCSTVENCTLKNKKLYLSKNLSEIYQVFIYNCNGELLAATGEYDASNGSISLDDSLEFYEPEKHTAVEEDVLVFYTYKQLDGVGFNLEQNIYQYLTLDFILEGNVDDESRNSYIHINKCSLRVDKNMYFNRTLNAVDLKFTIINDGESYMTLEQ